MINYAVLENAEIKTETSIFCSNVTLWI